MITSGEKKVDVIYPYEKKTEIDTIQFIIGSHEDIRKLSHLEVSENDIYNVPSKRPVLHGVLDERMGVSSKMNLCTTCGLKMTECSGHWGYIKLEVPVFHIGFFKSIVRTLQKICKKCSRVLLTYEEKLKFLEQFRTTTDNLKRKDLNKSVTDQCQKCRTCPYCGEFNGKIKKVANMKIIHEKYDDKLKISKAFREKFYSTIDTAMKENSEVRTLKGRIQEDLTTMLVKKLFENIPNEDVLLLDMDPTLSRPERMLWDAMLVPPACIRPTVPTTGGTNEDDLTTNLAAIIAFNKRIQTGVQKGEKIESIMEVIDELHFQCAKLLNSELPGFSMRQKTGRKQRSIVQRLKGKHGRFRGNLCGKRVDFSARSVISPDPNMDIDQVAIPVLMAKELTYPERVCNANLKLIQQLIINGSDKHPGACFVTQKNNKFQKGKQMKIGLKNMTKEQRIKLSQRIKIGDIVERHLKDDDLVLFNRQPSLHRISIMCHRAKVMPFRTLRFNLCCCTPYNADFDGDEMNVHFPQTEEAKAECQELMSVKRNLNTPRSGQPLIAAMQDFITCGFVLTRKDTFLTRDQFCSAIFYMNIKERIDIPPPTIVYPVELWTGKQLINILIKPNKECPILINLEMKGRNYSGKGEYFDINDSYICIQNSELLSGMMDKSVLGGGNKQSLFYLITKNYGIDMGILCMARIAKFSSNWLTNKGFSFGFDDVTPSESLLEYKAKLIEKEDKEFERLLKLFLTNELKADPGCTIEQTFESKLNKNYSEIRSKSGKECFKNLHYSNSLAIMTRCGSKGSINNISQMISLVGQQSVGGKRIENGFEYRTLPHFDLHDRSPKAKGFISNSFYSGLTATEFFFHTMAGREGLVDTAVKTAETGYMQRRLMKALEDLSVQYDGTVRNSNNIVIQFVYGDDSLDPLKMEEDEGRCINFEVEWLNCFNSTDEIIGEKKWLTTDEMISITEAFLAGDTEDLIHIESGRTKMDVPGDVSLEKPFSRKFWEELMEFVGKKVSEIKSKEREIDDYKIIDARDRKAWRDFIRKSLLITEKNFCKFLDNIKKKYVSNMAEPGEAVGAIAGQSIGEPGTQMTLKTFHFAGVASMDVTLGVPRILEIINATSKIKTPIIRSLLTIRGDSAANIVKGRIERTTLGEICKTIEEIEEPLDYYIRIEIDRTILRDLQFDLTYKQVEDAIFRNPIFKKLLGKKAREEFISADVDDDLTLYLNIRSVSRNDFMDMSWYKIQSLKEEIKGIVISGIPSISRAIVKKSENSKKDDEMDTEEEDEMEMIAEGNGLLKVMTTPGVKSDDTTSNNILEVASVLGIEAGRKLIMSEIHFTMKQYGMSLDMRHLKLLADLMSFKGSVLGINRHGIMKMKSSVLLNASFERTCDHLFNAAIHTINDKVKGVSECIVVGRPITLGTGMIELLQDIEIRADEKKETLF